MENHSNTNDNLPRKKNILVIGAGLAGTTAAFALKRRGGRNCSVTVVDAGPDVAAVTSFANAGRFCPTSVSFGSPAKKSSIQRTFLPTWVKTNFLKLPTYDTRAPYQHHMAVDFTRLTLLYWGVCNLFVQNKTRAKRGHQLIARQAQLSMEETLKGFSASSLAKMSVQPGTLYLFRDEAALEAGKQKAALVNTKPTTYSMTTLDTARTVTRFPWLCDWKKVDSGEKEGALPLAVRVPGAVYVGSDWTADARQFVKGLVTSDSTVKFKFNTTASIVDGNTVRLVDAKGGSDEVVEADVVVLACGIYTNTLLPGGKRRLPMEGMRGFSIDLGGCAMADGGALPDVGIVDFSSGDLNFQLTPFGKNRVRIVGFADFVGTEGMDRARQDLESEGSPTSVLTNHVRFLFPSLTWESQRETWAGLRPMSPDNLPYVGRMAWEEGKAAGDVWVCCGHGSTGWTSATATAEVLAQTVFPPKEGATPEMAELTEALRPDRFAAAFTGSRFATVLDYVLGF